MKSLIIKIICAVLLCAFILSICACNETKPQANCDNGHNLVQVGYTAPTCQTIGAKVYTCSRCGYTETETLFPIDHDYQVKSTTPSTCTEKGLRLLECSMCHTPKTEEIPCCAHHYEHKTIAPTCFTDGEDFDECDTCGSRINLVITPKYTHKFSSKNSDDYSRCVLCGVGSALYKIQKIKGYVHRGSANIYCYFVIMDIDRPTTKYPVSIPEIIPSPDNYHVVIGKIYSSIWKSFQAKKLVCKNGLPLMKDGDNYIYFPAVDYNYMVTVNEGHSMENYQPTILFNAQRDPSTSEPFICDYPTTISIEFTPDICDWIEV